MRTTSPSPHASSRLAVPWWALLLPPLLVLLFVSLRVVLHGWGAIAYPYQIDREEGFLLEEALQLARGHSIYRPIDESPWIVGNYPPLYLMLFATTTWFTGPSLAGGRAIAWVSTLAGGALLALLVARGSRPSSVRPLAIALAPLLFFSTWELGEWIAFARVDLPSIALGLAALVVAVRGTSRSLGIAVLLCGLAFLTKPTQVFAPAAIVFALAWHRRWLDAGQFAFALAILNGGLIVGINGLTAGEYSTHVIAYNANAFHWDQVPPWLHHLWLFYSWRWVALAAALAGAAWVMWERRGDTSSDVSTADGNDRPPLDGPCALAYLALTAVSLLSVAKVGSAGNYLLEFQAAAAWVLATAVARMGEDVARRPWPYVVVAFLLTLHVVDFAVVPRMPAGDGGSVRRVDLFPRLPTPGILELNEAVELEVIAADGAVWCEEPIFTLRAGREVVFEPFIMSQLAAEGKWDEAPVLRLFRERHFALVVTTQDIRNEDQWFASFTPAMRAALREQYQLKQRIGPWWLWVPKEEG